MSEAFIWRDRKGIEHRLDSPDFIEAEDRAIETELDALMPNLGSADDRIFLDAFAVARPLRLCAARVAEDLKRWDQHATALIIAESAAAVVAIAAFVAEAKCISTLHKTYDDFEAAHRAVDAAMRSGPPSAAQRAAIATACTRLGRLPEQFTTFDAAQAWLVNEPTTHRVSRPRSSPTFEWADRHGHHHQLRSVRPIEEEYIALAVELEALAGNLTAEVIETRRIALVQTRHSLQRLAIIQSNMAAWSADAINLARNDVAEWRKART